MAVANSYYKANEYWVISYNYYTNSEKGLATSSFQLVDCDTHFHSTQPCTNDDNRLVGF